MDVLAACVGLPHGYFSTLAKWVNFWRVVGRANKIESYAEKEFFADEPFMWTHFQRRPPACISGRWMSVESTEKFFLDIPCEDLSAVAPVHSSSTVQKGLFQFVRFALVIRSFHSPFF